MISAVAAAMGRTARVALRVNPDVDAGTHAKITTGRAENKFGIAYRRRRRRSTPAWRALPGIEPGRPRRCISAARSPSAWRPTAPPMPALAELVRALRGRGLPVSRVDCGGGLGIPYRDEPAPSPEALAGAIKATLRRPGPAG